MKKLMNYLLLVALTVILVGCGNVNKQVGKLEVGTETESLQDEKAAKADLNKALKSSEKVDKKKNEVENKKKETEKKETEETEKKETETTSDNITNDTKQEYFQDVNRNDYTEDTSVNYDIVYNYEDSINQFTEYYDRDKAIAVFDMINAERAANGISQLAWDESIYEFACKRAPEIVTDFSHNGCGNYGENIHMATWTESANEIHTAYYNSPPHHENYLYDAYDRGAVAVYIYNGGTYCVENFAIPVVNTTDYESAKTSETGMPQSYADGSYVVDHWKASNGVTVDILSNGNLQSGYPNSEFDAETTMGMIQAALDEYYACH